MRNKNSPSLDFEKAITAVKKIDIKKSEIIKSVFADTSIPMSDISDLILLKEYKNDDELFDKFNDLFNRYNRLS